MLGELAGRGWVSADPPLDRDNGSTIARCDGTPIKAGFMIEKVEDSDAALHTKYRSGQYDVELRLDFEDAGGELRVEEASGYD